MPKKKQHSLEKRLRSIERQLSSYTYDDEDDIETNLRMSIRNISQSDENLGQSMFIRLNETPWQHQRESMSVIEQPKILLIEKPQQTESNVKKTAVNNEEEKKTDATSKKVDKNNTEIQNIFKLISQKDDKENSNNSELESFCKNYAVTFLDQAAKLTEPIEKSYEIFNNISSKQNEIYNEKLTYYVVDVTTDLCSLAKNKTIIKVEFFKIKNAMIPDIDIIIFLFEQYRLITNDQFASTSITELLQNIATETKDAAYNAASNAVNIVLSTSLNDIVRGRKEDKSKKEVTTGFRQKEIGQNTFIVKTQKDIDKWTESVDTILENSELKK